MGSLWCGYQGVINETPTLWWHNLYIQTMHSVGVSFITPWYHTTNW